MTAIVVRGAMGLRPGQVLRKLDSRMVAEADWVAIEKSDGYKVLKDRYGRTGVVDEPPDYAGEPQIVTVR